MQQFNKPHIQHHFDHAAVSYDDAAVLQKQVATHLDERLELVTLQPQRILDIGAGTGILTEKIGERYPQAHTIALDLSERMLHQAHQKLRAFNWLPDLFRKPIHPFLKSPSLLNADAASLPLQNASIDLIVSNLMLQWSDDLDKTFAEFRRVLKPEGLLMFTTFGPDTLKELRQAWASVDQQQHVNTFIDMHDIGDALIRNGFGQPVMDVEDFVLTYEKPIGVLKDLKAIGATYAGQDRQKSLMGKHHFTQMLNAYETLRMDGKIPATYEVVHGHAWASPELIKGPERDRNGLIEISLEEFARQTRS